LWQMPSGLLNDFKFAKPKLLTKIKGEVRGAQSRHTQESKREGKETTTTTTATTTRKITWLKLQRSTKFIRSSK